MFARHYRSDDFPVRLVSVIIIHVPRHVANISIRKTYLSSSLPTANEWSCKRHKIFHVQRPWRTRETPQRSRKMRQVRIFAKIDSCRRYKFRKILGYRAVAERYYLKTIPRNSRGNRELNKVRGNYWKFKKNGVFFKKNFRFKMKIENILKMKRIPDVQSRYLWNNFKMNTREIPKNLKVL